jgi:hypothetical protein
MIGRARMFLHEKPVQGGIGAVESPDSPARSGLLPSNALPLLGHGALLQEHEEQEPQAQDGEQPEDAELGQGRRLPLAEIGERLEGSTAATGPDRPSAA